MAGLELADFPSSWIMCKACDLSGTAGIATVELHQEQGVRVGDDLVQTPQRVLPLTR